MSLTIALAHPEIIPPRLYGGTERVVAHLAQSLLRLGHRVVLMSARGSSVPGVEWVEFSHGEDPEARLPAGVDLLHLWGPPSREPRVPYLLTIEGNGKPGERFLRNTVFVSRKHAENHGSIHFVYNGTDPGLYPSDQRREDVLVFLSKASWSVKNLEGAIAVARGAGLPLEVIGSRSWPLEAQRWLRWRGVRYHGMLTDSEKSALLRNARGLVFPVRWHEPFGIALIEGLLSGCPVYGTPYGSLPEIVGPSVGVLANSATELVKAIHGRRFEPEVCRNWAVERFSADVMAAKYLEYYSQVLSQGGLLGTPESPTGIPAPATRGGDGYSSEALLPWHP